MRKKILAVVLTGILAVGALTGCGAKSDSKDSAKASDDKKNNSCSVSNTTCRNFRRSKIFA